MLQRLARELRAAVGQASGVAETAQGVADRLRTLLPGPDILTPQQRLGDPDRYQQHVLHVEPDGSFSIVGLVWRPGQYTPVHDHLAWCVVAVLDGTEHETIYRLSEGSTLVPVSETTNAAGDISCCVPPGDIHRVSNIGAETAISLHVYGADIRGCGSSIKRTYESPVQI